MIVDVAQILTGYGTSIVQQIQRNLASSGENASGQTSRSLRFSVERKGSKDILRIVGRPYFMTVETGRKPTPQYEPSRSFVQKIKDWLAAKGLEQGPAYAIARNIHKKGTKLWRQGGRKDIVSNVITPSLFTQIEQDLLKEFGKRYLLALKQTYDNGNQSAPGA